MNSRNLVNLFLFALLLTFVMFYYFRSNEPQQSLRLTSLEANKIERIHIPRDNNEDILFIKLNSTSGSSYWQMKQPYDIQAHPFRIKTLLAITQLDVDNQYAASELKLDDYALSPPRARIVFDDTEISFGKTNPVNSKRYLMANNYISLHLDQTYPLVSAQATSFINLSLLSGHKSIVKLQLPHLSLQRSDSGDWTTTPEQHLTADQIQLLLDSWSNTQAFAVHKYLPRKQLGKIHITTLSGEITFDISDDEPWLILGREDLGIEYHLDASLKARLFGDPDA